MTVVFVFSLIEILALKWVVTRVQTLCRYHALLHHVAMIKLDDDSRLTSKQSVKSAVVERAIYTIDRDVAPALKDTVSKLGKFLNTDD